MSFIYNKESINSKKSDISNYNSRIQSDLILTTNEAFHLIEFQLI